MEYEYYSTNSFYVFVTVSRIRVQVTVRDGDRFGDDGVVEVVEIGVGS